MAKIPFESRISFAAVLRSPKRKLPYIIDDGEVIADSEFIIEHVKRKHNIWLDNWLTPAQSATAYTVRRMLEDGTYWIIIYGRWIEPAVWTTYKYVVFSWVPAPMRLAIAALANRDYKRRCYGQGIARYSRSEISHIAARDVETISTMLGENSFFFGERPASIDAVIFGFFGNAYYAPLQTDVKQAIGGHANLVAYLDRVRDLVKAPAV
jgi:glutathione S-transferase